MASRQGSKGAATEGSGFQFELNGDAPPSLEEICSLDALRLRHLDDAIGVCPYQGVGGSVPGFVVRVVRVLRIADDRLVENVIAESGRAAADVILLLVEGRVLGIVHGLPVLHMHGGALAGLTDPIRDLLAALDECILLVLLLPPHIGEDGGHHSVDSLIVLTGLYHQLEAGRPISGMPARPKHSSGFSSQISFFLRSPTWGN